MSAEAHVAKDSDEKSYTHSCCSWKVTYQMHRILTLKIFHSIVKMCVCATLGGNFRVGHSAPYNPSLNPIRYLNRKKG